MKEKLKAILLETRLLHIWNRYLGGNRVRIHGGQNQLHIGKSLLTHTQIQIRGENNVVSIGNGSRLRDLKILVTGNNHCVEISDNCQLRGKIKAEDTDSHVSIGPGTTMENTYLGAYEGTSIHIGSDCMLSDQVGVRTGDMHSILDQTTKIRLNPSQSIMIESNVWLCRGTTVLKGCTIGSRTVVGGFSIVTTSLPSGILAIGIPTRMIRENIDWKRERIPLDQ